MAYIVMDVHRQLAPPASVSPHLGKKISRVHISLLAHPLSLYGNKILSCHCSKPTPTENIVLKKFNLLLEVYFYIYL